MSLVYKIDFTTKIMKIKNASLSILTATLLVAANIAIITTITVSSMTGLQSANASLISSTSRNFGGFQIVTISTSSSAIFSLDKQDAAHKKVEQVFGVGGGVDDNRRTQAPMATSRNNVYITWWSNKSGDWEVFFKASTDGGKTFGPKINLSNSKGVVSNNAEIAASGNNVYVSWWERANQRSNEPVMRVSNDNGKTFGDKIMLSNNATSA
jgi:hypothetical protein